MTVEGLSPEVLLAGSIVTVKQGSKVVEKVTGIYKMSLTKRTQIGQSGWRDSFGVVRADTVLPPGTYFIDAVGGDTSGFVNGAINVFTTSTTISCWKMAGSNGGYVYVEVVVYDVSYE